MEYNEKFLTSTTYKQVLLEFRKIYIDRKTPAAYKQFFKFIELHCKSLTQA